MAPDVASHNIPDGCGEKFHSGRGDVRNWGHRVFDTEQRVLKPRRGMIGVEGAHQVFRIGFDGDLGGGFLVWNGVLLDEVGQVEAQGHNSGKNCAPHSRVEGHGLRCISLCLWNPQLDGHGMCRNLGNYCQLETRECIWVCCSLGYGRESNDGLDEVGR